MACALGFRELANHNPFVQELEDQGYLVDFINGYFIIYGLPYLDKDGTLKHGDWISPVDLTNNVLDPPSNHQAWFRGSRPHDQSGRALRLGGGPGQVTVAEGYVTDHSFSFKLTDGGVMRPYRSFEEKVNTYLEVITAPALAAYSDATPLHAIAIKAAEQGSPLRFPDTLSSRYNINDVSALLKGKKVAIIGLGGTGAYILDFLARTHLERIALFDDDDVQVHTIFRIPGYIHRAIGQKKVDAFAQQYGNWHNGIVPIAELVTSGNIERLREFDFVFVSIDNGPSRLQIVGWLSANSIPFVDCGMGLNRSVTGMNGVVRVTGVDRSAFEQSLDTPYLPTGDNKADEYRKQAQIAELNALNAAFAVIRFKQHFRLYEREDDAVSYIFETASFEINAVRQ
ncbi:ThiF family adenylyltransferase [Dongia soli]|uniref:ThiF family adenylyltransferase n=1 Tax=Dongia soli TaxID=600628 RepID=A0ABU5EHN0_9PROT|nr:ThiF family adenylyltransferase [Dongia soli]MDY0885382.1 ThiF family adenylyltransferase [Dongia soli]